MQSNKVQAATLGFNTGAGEKFLTVQIKETASQFSNPLYLPPGQKNAAYQVTYVIEDSADLV